jgi:hypothetical protein
MTFTYPNIF